MSLRLVGTEPEIFTVEDTAIGIRPMTNGEKMNLASQIASMSDDPGRFGTLMELVAQFVDSIEGQRDPDIDIADTITHIADINTQQAIIEKVLSISGLDELQAKNSESSSGISTDSAGPSNTKASA